MAASILVVDDEPASRDGLVDVLRDEGYDVRAAATAEEGLEILESSNFELVISDFRVDGHGRITPGRAGASAAPRRL